MAQQSSSSVEWDDVVKKFASLVVGSPSAVVALVANFIFGYLLSFVIFNYRVPAALGRVGMLAVGICYACVVFFLVNFDMVFNKNFSLDYDDISNRIPITLLIEGAVAFPIVLFIMIRREGSNREQLSDRARRAAETRRRNQHATSQTQRVNRGHTTSDI